MVLLSRTQSKLDAVAEELKRLNPKITVKVIKLDFETATDADFDRVEAQLKGLDIGLLVNNVAGVTRKYSLSLLSNDEVRRVLNLNIMSTVAMSRIVGAGMLQRKRGAIVNISSMAARLTPTLGLYAATKSFVRMFSVILKMQYGHAGIIVQEVEPGYVDTKMAQKPIQHYFSQGFIKRLWVPTPELVAQHSLYTLGRLDDTAGTIGHCIQTEVMPFIDMAADSAKAREIVKALDAAHE